MYRMADKQMVEAKIVERLIFWIKKCLYGRDRYCSSFCVTCRHYEICRYDEPPEAKQ